MPPTLEYLLVDQKIINQTIVLYYALLPSMFMRTIGDSMRSLLQGMGFMSSLGLCNLINLIIFLPYAYWLMSSMKNPLIAYGLIFAIYETLGLL